MPNAAEYLHFNRIVGSFGCTCVGIRRFFHVNGFPPFKERGRMMYDMDLSENGIPASLMGCHYVVSLIKMPRLVGLIP